MSTKQKIFQVFAAGISTIGFAAIYRAAVKINTGADPGLFQAVLSLGFGITIGLVVFSVLVGSARGWKR